MVKVGDKAKTLSGNTVVITKDLGGDLFECRTDHPTTNDFGCDGSKVLLRAENLEPFLVQTRRAACPKDRVRT